MVWRLIYKIFKLFNYKNVFVKPEKEVKNKVKKQLTQEEKDKKIQQYMLIGGLLVLSVGISLIYLPAALIFFGLFWMVFSGLCPFLKEK